MVRRLFALVLLLALVAGGLYFSKLRPGGARGFPGLGQTLDEARLTTAVRTALALNRRLSGADVSVAAERGGVITLAGVVPSEEARTLALEVARDVPGVARAVDGLHVVAPGPRSPGDDRTLGERLDDQALEAKLRLAFALSRALAGASVQVRVTRRQVALTGTCASAGQRERLLQVARDVPDVSGVEAHLLSIPGQPLAP